MPWTIIKSSSLKKPWKIIRADTRKVVGSSTTKAKAEASVRAWYANYKEK